MVTVSCWWPIISANHLAAVSDSWWAALALRSPDKKSWRGAVLIFRSLLVESMIGKTYSNQDTVC
jgi:hypothetical protein